MSFDELASIIKQYNPDADFALLRKAFDFASRAHEGQRRLSGEPYINHPVRAAATLAHMKLELSIVVACLLHDVPEDTPMTIDDIRKEFGDDTARMVEGITKLGKVKYRGAERYVENLRKMFIAMANDARTILIKFADRLDNLRTLDAQPPKKQHRIALETLEIFAPIANRLGMGEMKGWIEDEAFKYVYPKEYEWVRLLVEERFKEKKAYIDNVKKITEEALERNGITVLQADGRLKHLYSLYRKLLKYDRDITKIYDLFAIRFIVNDVAQCYSVLGVVHNLWKPLKGRIKDYIAQQKPNGYQSLHTTVFALGGEIVEFQIRTAEMQEDAEYGIAAHWLYDESGKIAKRLVRHQAWIDELSRIHKEVVQGLRDMDALKVDVFKNRIFVFTPRGDVIDLPEEATPVDFAYAVHTEVGNRCAGAWVNGELARLDTQLKSGDVIEVIIDKNRKGPSADWLAFVKTSSARSKIKTHLKQSLVGWVRSVLPRR